TQPDAIAGRVIQKQEVTLDDVRHRAVTALPPRSDGLPERIPYSTAGSKVLELSLREALRLNHNYIGTEHVLLALLELEHGQGILSEAGITEARSEELVLAALDAIVKGRAVT